MQESLLYHEVHGSNGPYLLLVHGIMSSRAQWIPNIDFLKTFCRPVIVELLGHGRSPSPNDSQFYTPDNYCHEFERIRYKLGVERWFVCGQSLGASLTLRYSLNHPKHIIAQIFTNSRSALSENTSEDTMKIVVKSIDEKGRKALDNFPLHPAKSKHLKPEIKKALVEDVDLINLRGISNTMLYMVTRCSVCNIIHKNQVPTLLVVGKFDKQFAHLVKYAEKTIAKLEVKVFEGGHAVNIDAAEQFNNALQNFILRCLKEG